MRFERKWRFKDDFEDFNLSNWKDGVIGWSCYFLSLRRLGGGGIWEWGG